MARDCLEMEELGIAYRRDLGEPARVGPPKHIRQEHLAAKHQAATPNCTGDPQHPREEQNQSAWFWRAATGGTSVVE